MSIGMIVVTALGLIVGLGGLYLAWRFVSGLPTERRKDDDPPHH